MNAILINSFVKKKNKSSNIAKRKKRRMLWFVIEEALDFREFHKQSRVLSYTIIHIVLHKFLYVHHWLLEKKCYFFDSCYNLHWWYTIIRWVQFSTWTCQTPVLVSELVPMNKKKKGRDVSNLTKLDAD